MSKQPATHLLLLNLWSHLSKRRRSQFFVLLFLMLISSVCEVISIGAVLPFLGILSSPDYIQHNQKLIQWFPELITYDVTQSLQFITLIFILLILLSAAIRALVLWCNTKFAFSAGADLSFEVYKKTLLQPYEIHTLGNSSEIVSGILHKVHGVINGELLPSLIGVNAIILISFIIIALIATNPTLSFAAIMVFGISYFVLGYLSKRKLASNSSKIAEMQTKVVRTLQEGLGGIREIILDNSQRVYFESYQNAERPLQKAQSSNVFLAQSPRFIIETLGVVILSAFAYFMVTQSGDPKSVLPTLGFLALGAQRLLPTLQQLYNAWASIFGSLATLKDTLDLLNKPIDIEHSTINKVIKFEKNIVFKNVSFKYQGSDRFILKNVNLTIPKSSTIGIVGLTGSGKSTLIDLMMGLLKPTEGEIFVDDMALNAEIIHSWRSKISHVPQNVYLSESSFAENIAFGLSKNNIDIEKVRYAAEVAEIFNFIESQPSKYFSRVAEHGGNLSGGQRQRIVIARALYKDSSVLILDEATSALDAQTEQSIMESLSRLENGLTMIMISHRMETLKNCDFLITVDNQTAVINKQQNH